MAQEYEQYDYLTTKEVLTWQPFNEYGFASPWAPRLWKSSAGKNYLVSGLVTLFIAATFTLVSEQCRHSCLIPLVVCGILAGVDLVAWLRKEIDIFDPKVIVAGALYLNCFLAPLMHLTYNIYGRGISTSDWPTYFGYMACFNAVGITLYKLAQNMSFGISRPSKTLWQLAPGTFVVILLPALGISLVANAIIRIFFGGLVKEAGILTVIGSPHLSWLLMLGDATPVLLMMAMIYWIYRRRADSQRSLLTVVTVLIITFVFQFLWVGARGGRGATLSIVIIIGAIIHYRLRPFSIKLILVGMCLAFTFAHLYNYYKMLGPRGWAAFYSAKARESMRHELGGATITETVLGHFARADLQAMMLSNLISNEMEYRLRMGRTYRTAMLMFIPRGIWKTKPFMVKERAGAELQGSRAEISTRAYGLAGEAMLNFGYYGIVPAFFVFGLIFGWFRKKLATMEPSDSRFFLIPILMLSCVFAITSDSDVLMFGLLKRGILPFIVVFFGSIRSKFVPDYL